MEDLSSETTMTYLTLLELLKAGLMVGVGCDVWKKLRNQGSELFRFRFPGSGFSEKLETV